MSEPKTNDVQYFLNLVQSIGHEGLQNIIALRRMPDGSQLDEEGLGVAMQALIRYETEHMPLEQRTGFIAKAQCNSKA